MNPTIPKKTIDLDRVYQDCLEFLAGFHTLVLATCSREGMPEASYAPFVCHEGDYFIYITELAPHTGNLIDTGRASILFIEDEDKTPQLFARQRLTLQCEAQEIPPGHELFGPVVRRFRDRFGAIVETLVNLEDFHLFRLHPYQGRYVQGFGRAFELSGERLERLRHLNRGHRRRPMRVSVDAI